VTVLVFASTLLWSVEFGWVVAAGLDFHILGTVPAGLAYTGLYIDKDLPEGKHITGVYTPSRTFPRLPQDAIGLRITGTSPRLRTPRQWLQWPAVERQSPAHCSMLLVAVPMWAVFLVIAIPSAILWYRDRPPPKGHCQNCGYDLTGNVSGVCPECGDPT
jgi:hypothetical protein